MGPNYYSIDDPTAIKTIYGHGTQYEKSKWYEVWNARHDLYRTNLFALRDIKAHSSTRRHYAGVYAMSSLVSYEPYVNNCIDILSNRLRMCAKSGETIDLSKWFQYYAFDVIGEITVCSIMSKPRECSIRGTTKLTPTILTNSTPNDSAFWKPERISLA